MAWRCSVALAILGVAFLGVVGAAGAQEAPPLKAGIIGCDTSHVGAFTKLLNDPKAPPELAGVRIVAAFPGGTDVPPSRDRVEKFTAELKAQGIVICPSIEELLKQVDVIFLESVDGRPHLEQARPVIAAGKPLFIDKPMASSLADAMEIFRLAKEKGVPVFSSSALRFQPAYQEIRRGTSPFGEIRSCVATSPMTTLPHHPELFYYGIHGVESLFTIMGPGCKEVKRTGPEEVVGVWADGRIGTYRAAPLGAEVVGSRQSGKPPMGDVYGPMMREIVQFFKTGQPPVTAEETLEVLAFMEAADASKAQNGAAVSLESTMEKARQANAARQP